MYSKSTHRLTTVAFAHIIWEDLTRKFCGIAIGVLRPEKQSGPCTGCDRPGGVALRQALPRARVVVGITLRVRGISAKVVVIIGRWGNSIGVDVVHVGLQFF